MDVIQYNSMLNQLIRYQNTKKSLKMISREVITFVNENPAYFMTTMDDDQPTQNKVMRVSGNVEFLDARDRYVAARIYRA